MLKFFIKRELRPIYTGPVISSIETICVELPDLEILLTDRYMNDVHDVREIVAVDIVGKDGPTRQGQEVRSEVVEGEEGMTRKKLGVWLPVLVTARDQPVGGGE